MFLGLLGTPRTTKELVPILAIIGAAPKGFIMHIMYCTAQVSAMFTTISWLLSMIAKKAFRNPPAKQRVNGKKVRKVNLPISKKNV
jgi:hypothetical protein